MTRPRLGVLLLSGVRHQASYAPLIAAHPRLRLVALVDEPDLPPWMAEANAALAARWQIPYLTDVDSALARDDVDVVSVCSEPTRHARLATRAVCAGKHVLVDKPLGLTVAECDTVAAAVSQTRKPAKLTFVHRLFSPAVQRIRSEIDSGRLGLPWAIHVTWLASGGLSGGTVEDDALVADPRLSGGGELANFLGYPVGYIRYLTGLEVERVYAVTGTHVHSAHRQHGVEDFGVVELRLQRDVLASVTVGRLAAGSTPGAGVFSLRVHGSQASVTVDEERPEVRAFNAGRVHAVHAAGSAGEQALRALIDDFVTCIDDDRAPLCGIHDARALAAVLEGAYASAACGEMVHVA